MKFPNRLIAASILLTICAAPVAGGAQTQEAGATFYQHGNYGGYAVTLAPGQYDMNTLIARGILDNDVSSLRVPPGYEVVLYEHPGYTGTSRTYSSDVSWVGDFNDRLSSAVVKKIRDQPPSRHTLQVFVRGTDNCLYAKSLDQSTWAWDAWTDFARIPTPCDMASPPAAGYIVMMNGLFSPSTEETHVIYRRSDNHVVDARYNGNSWAVTDMGGLTLDAPAVVNVQDGQLGGHLAVYYRGVDNNLWVNTLRSLDGFSDGWDGQQMLPIGQGNIASGPTATTLDLSDGTYVQLMFRRLNDSAVGEGWQHVKNASGDTLTMNPAADWGEGNLGGTTYSAPAVARFMSGGWFLFVRGTDNGLWMRSWSETVGLSNWYRRGGNETKDVQSGITATVVPNRHNSKPQWHVFWRNSNNDVAHTWFESGWNTDTIGGSTYDTPSAMSRNPGYKP